MGSVTSLVFRRDGAGKESFTFGFCRGLALDGGLSERKVVPEPSTRSRRVGEGVRDRLEGVAEAGEATVLSGLTCDGACWLALDFWFCIFTGLPFLTFLEVL